MKVALVTGVTGFVGGALVRQLYKEGWQVHGIVRPSSNVDKIQDYCAVYSETSDIAELTAYISSIKPDVVFHIASMVIGDHQAKQVSELIDANIKFPSNLVEAMCAAGVTRLVNTGTSWEYYHSQNYNPVNLYAATKKAFEDILFFYNQAKSLSCINLKLFDNYGPNDTRKKLINLLLDVAKTGRTLDMTLGEQFIDITHIDDLVQAYIVAANMLLTKSENVFETYFVSGERLSLRELVGVIERKLEKPIQINWGEKPYRVREVMWPVPCSERTLPNWAIKHKIFDFDFD